MQPNPLPAANSGRLFPLLRSGKWGFASRRLWLRKVVQPMQKCREGASLTAEHATQKISSKRFRSMGFLPGSEVGERDGNDIGGCLSNGAHEWLRNATDV